MHTDRSLTLVFEYLDKDLKQYMDSCNGLICVNNVKVSLVNPNMKVAFFKFHQSEFVINDSLDKQMIFRQFANRLGISLEIQVPREVCTEKVYRLENVTFEVFKMKCLPCSLGCSFCKRSN